MLKIIFTAEILPVGIVNPPLKYRFITEIVGVFSIVKTDHEPSAFSRSPKSRVIKFAKGLVKF